MAEKLGLYVHIPFCRSKCDYCDFYSLAGKEGRMDDYQKALLAHMKETAPLTRGWQVDTVYFGGGTPSFYGEKRLREVLKTVAKRFDLAKDAEITVECNPDSVDKKVFQALRRAGVNRISLGVQSAHDCELNCLHRPHTFQQAQRAVAAAREAKIKNLSLDFIINLNINPSRNHSCNSINSNTKKPHRNYKKRNQGDIPTVLASNSID